MEGSAGTGRIERDLEHTRARLDATLGALQHKLSPGQMVDETMSWFKQGGGQEFGRNLGRNVRDNPIPVALIGIGLGWLMLGGGGGSGRGRHQGESRYEGGGTAYRAVPDAPRAYGSVVTEHQPLPYEAAAYEDLATKANDAGARVERGTDESDDSYHDRLYSAKGSAVGVTRQLGETLSAFRDRVETAIEAAADRFRRLGQQVSSMASGAGDRAGSTAQQGKAGVRSLYGYGQSAAYSARDGAGYASYKARDMGGRTAEYLKDQPLLMGVLGVATGAVLGMLIPATRYEREIAGDLRRTLGEQARGVASELSQKAARVAEDVLDTAQDAARREGLTNVSPGGVAQQARAKVADAAGRVRNVVEETASAGRESLQRELGSGGGGSAGAGSRTEGAATTPSSSSAAAASTGHGDRRPIG